jgi:hypothetical protein
MGDDRTCIHATETAEMELSADDLLHPAHPGRRRVGQRFVTMMATLHEFLHSHQAEVHVHNRYCNPGIQGGINISEKKYNRNLPGAERKNSSRLPNGSVR